MKRDEVAAMAPAAKAMTAMAMVAAAMAAAAMTAGSRAVIGRARPVSGRSFCALRGVTGNLLLAGEAMTPPKSYPPSPN